MSDLTVGSVFAGIGGLDLGLEAAGGFRTAWYSEIEPSALAVLAHRFPHADPLGDVVALAGATPPPVDVLTGGPPCQDLSKANMAGRLGLAGARSGLFHPYARIIEKTAPRWVVMEQVVGLITSNGGADLATVFATFRSLGYAVATTIADSLRYVPQRRERIIFVAHRDRDAAERALLPLREDGSRDLGTKRPTIRSSARGTADGARVYRKSRRPQSKLDGESWVWAEYANTLTINDLGVTRATVIVLDENDRPRVLTPVEWERCHGFPDDWTLPASSDRKRWTLLGNAVSPPVARRVGEGILAAEGVPHG